MEADVLDYFYTTTKPPGLWGQARTRCTECTLSRAPPASPSLALSLFAAIAVRKEIASENYADMFGVVFALGFQLSLFTAWMVCPYSSLSS